MKVRLEIGSIGIIGGDDKRALECYVDTRMFRQRKSYDEYYIDCTNIEVDIDLNDLMILGEDFKVVVLSDSVIISTRE